MRGTEDTDRDFLCDRQDTEAKLVPECSIEGRLLDLGEGLARSTNSPALAG